MTSWMSSSVPFVLFEAGANSFDYYDDDYHFPSIFVVVAAVVVAAVLVRWILRQVRYALQQWRLRRHLQRHPTAMVIPVVGMKNRQSRAGKFVRTVLVWILFVSRMVADALALLVEFIPNQLQMAVNYNYKNYNSTDELTSSSSPQSTISANNNDDETTSPSGKSEHASSMITAKSDASARQLQQQQYSLQLSAQKKENKENNTVTTARKTTTDTKVTAASSTLLRRPTVSFSETADGKVQSTHYYYETSAPPSARRAPPASVATFTKTANTNSTTTTTTTTATRRSLPLPVKLLSMPSASPPLPSQVPHTPPTKQSSTTTMNPPSSSSRKRRAEDTYIEDRNSTQQQQQQEQKQQSADDDVFIAAVKRRKQNGGSRGRGRFYWTSAPLTAPLEPLRPSKQRIEREKRLMEDVQTPRKRRCLGTNVAGSTTTADSDENPPGSTTTNGTKPEARAKKAVSAVPDGVPEWAREALSLAAVTDTQKSSAAATSTDEKDGKNINDAITGTASATVNATEPGKTPFKFGSTATDSKTSASATTTAVSSSGGSSAFKFGNNATSSASAPVGATDGAPATAPVFSFQSDAAPDAAPNSSAKPATTTEGTSGDTGKPAFSFGIQASTSAQPAAQAGANTAAPTIFSFGSNKTGESADPIGDRKHVISTAGHSAPAFAFGSTPNTTAAPPSTFADSAPSNQPSFALGSTATTTPAANTPGSSGFGSSASNNNATSIGPKMFGAAPNTATPAPPYGTAPTNTANFAPAATTPAPFGGFNAPNGSIAFDATPATDRSGFAQTGQSSTSGLTPSAPFGGTSTVEFWKSQPAGGMQPFGNNAPGATTAQPFSFGNQTSGFGQAAPGSATGPSFGGAAPAGDAFQIGTQNTRHRRPQRQQHRRRR